MRHHGTQQCCGGACGRCSQPAVPLSLQVTQKEGRARPQEAHSAALGPPFLQASPRTTLDQCRSPRPVLLDSLAPGNTPHAGVSHPTRAVVFSAFNVKSGLVCSPPSPVLCFIFVFEYFFLIPIAKIKTSKLWFGTFLLIILMSVRVFSSAFELTAHVKTAVSTMGPFYWLYSSASGPHASRRPSPYRAAILQPPIPTSPCFRLADVIYLGGDFVFSWGGSRLCRVAAAAGALPTATVFLWTLTGSCGRIL